MIKHLMVLGEAALTDSLLTNLGRLNVVCGRNNSGKTTLLSSLTVNRRCMTGVDTSDELASGFAMSYTNQTVFRNGDQLNQHGRMLLANTRGALHSRQLWFAHQYQEFFSEFESRWKASALIRSWRPEEQRAKPAFNSLFPAAPNRLLIPAKRKMELDGQLHPAINVEPDGARLLNLLFQYKNQEVNSDQRNLYEALRGAFQDISGGYTLDIVTANEARLQLRFRTPKGHSAYAADCGLGMQDLIVLLYFALEPSASLLAIEEPESHLHPDMQRKFLQFISERDDKQYIFSTHSNVFLDGAFVDRVFFTTYSDRIEVRDETNRALVLSDLGYQVSDNLVSDLIVLVEGPKDVPILEAFLHQIGVLGRYSVKFWPLGGDIMDQIDLSVFAERYQIRALIDTDTKSRQVRERFRAKCDAAGIPVHQLKRYAIENYLSLKALREIFKEKIPESIDKLDPMTPVEKQLGFSVKGNARAISRAMNISEIEGTDLYEFLISLRDLLARTGQEQK